MLRSSLHNRSFQAGHGGRKASRGPLPTLLPKAALVESITYDAIGRLTWDASPLPDADNAAILEGYTLRPNQVRGPSTAVEWLPRPLRLLCYIHIVDIVPSNSRHGASSRLWAFLQLQPDSLVVVWQRAQRENNADQGCQAIQHTQQQPGQLSRQP
jgi:hypothetical protein